MKRWLLVAMVAATSLTVLSRAHAQESGVGNLRIVDESGIEVGREQAPPGEKHFRLPAGATELRIAFDYEGASPTPVQVRVMGPSGTVIHQSSEEYDTPDTYVVLFDKAGEPFAEQEYVVNIYIGTDPYLADSLQLVVGEAQIVSSEDMADVTTAPDQSQGVLTLETPVAEPDAKGPSIPGGPSWLVLALAAIGIVALGVVVIWAAISATRRR